MTNKTTEVSDYILNLSNPFKSEIEEIRDTILDANKEIKEHIKWNAPSFVYDGEDRITFRLSKDDEIHLIFHRGVKVKDTTNFEFKDDTGLIKWLAKDRGVVIFKNKQEIEQRKEDLTKLVNNWIAIS